MRVVLGGYRVVFEERARAFDTASANARAEEPPEDAYPGGELPDPRPGERLLLPIINPVWLQYVSHKVGRLLVPWALLLAFVSKRRNRKQHVVLRRGH